jgi:hypothetical protein
MRSPDRFGWMAEALHVSNGDATDVPDTNACARLTPAALRTPWPPGR